MSWSRSVCADPGIHLRDETLASSQSPTRRAAFSCCVVSGAGPEYAHDQAGRHKISRARREKRASSQR